MDWQTVLLLPWYSLQRTFIWRIILCIYLFCSWQSVSALANKSFSREGWTVRRYAPRGFHRNPSPLFYDKNLFSEFYLENCVNFKYNSRPTNVLFFNVLLFKVESQCPLHRYCKASYSSASVLPRGTVLVADSSLYNTRGEWLYKRTGFHWTPWAKGYLDADVLTVSLLLYR